MINKCVFRNKWIQIGLFANKDVKIKPVFSDCVCVCFFFCLMIVLILHTLYTCMYRVGKLLEKKEQEADTLMQIGDVLRKHDNDLEKQVQEIHREKQELDKEKEILQEQ